MFVFSPQSKDDTSLIFKSMVESSVNVFVCAVRVLGLRPKFIPWVITMASIVIVGLFVLPQMLLWTKLHSSLHGGSDKPGYMPPNSMTDASPLPYELLTEEERLLLQKKELAFQQEITRLQHEIKSLQDEIGKVKSRSKEEVTAVKTNEEESDENNEYKRQRNTHIQTLTSPITFSDPVQVVPYKWFNSSHVLTPMDERGIPEVVKVSSREKYEMAEVLKLNTVGNVDRPNRNWRLSKSPNNFEGGIMKNVPGVGVYYELLFGGGGSRGGGKSVVQMKAVRPFSTLQLNDILEFHTDWKDSLVIILTISNCVGKFSRFVSFLNKATFSESKSVRLTVVHFGKMGLSGVQRVLDKLSQRMTKITSDLLIANEPYSKIRGLKIALDKIANFRDDPLVVIMDVDIAFTREFFARCRHHVSRGRSVYYPIVFGLYNPNLIYPMIHHEKVPSLMNQLRIDGNKGSWQFTQYDLTCQYFTDLMEMIEKSDLSHSELFDRDLFKAYVKSDLKVYRIPDPSVYHIWHDRICFRIKEKENFDECMKNKIFSAGSQLQLGFLAFQKDMDISRGL